MVDQGNLEGQTWSAASGDFGANDCTDPALGTKKSTVDFPASLPNVLAVGGTTTTPMPVLGNIMGYSTESAWNELCTNGQTSGATGGGFSRIFPKPTWQTGKTFSDGDRDVPDVAIYADLFQPGSNCQVMPGAGYWVMFRGFWEKGAGTSIGPHIWDGILADIAQKDGHPFGNLLPALYSLESTAAFHQVVTGNNTFNGVTGFNAVAGYNQDTGLGSPDAAQLAALLTATAPPSPGPTIYPFPNPSPTATPSSPPTARALIVDKGTFANNGHVDIFDATVGSTDGNLLNSVSGFPFPLDLAIDATGSFAYVVEVNGQIDVLNTQTLAVTSNAVSDPATHPTSLAVRSNFLYVADEVARKVYVLPIPSSTATPAPAIAVGRLPSAVVANPSLTYVYVANAADNTVSIINTSTEAVVQTIKVGKDPVAMSVVPGGSQLLVANAGAGTVSLLNVATIPASVTATIKVGGEPAGLSVSPDSLRAYVLNLVDPSVPSAGGVIEVILLANRPRTVECCLGPFPYLSNLAIEPTGRYL